MLSIEQISKERAKELKKYSIHSKIDKMGLDKRYQTIRKQTEILCDPLEIEDFVVQPYAEISPPKWHLAHTTWFFETMILEKHVNNYVRYNDQYNKLFNSYYKGAGNHWPQEKRGQLSRPTVRDVMNYRRYVDDHMLIFFKASLSDELINLVDTGLHHEQQHQELLLMDIKAIFSVNPTEPIYSKNPLPKAPSRSLDWIDVDGGIIDIGHKGDGFSYDNERPRHSVMIIPHRLSATLLTNGQFLEFIEDDGYSRPELWLSPGWHWVETHNITNPLYWKKNDGEYMEFTLHGVRALDKDAPLVHVSYFEAIAYANWNGCRLPSEAEMEIFLETHEDNELTGYYHPNDVGCHTNQVWTWTNSHYSPYPNFKPYKGLLGEYNGKFMCNQFVLKGGCVATPEHHLRSSYRNFYRPHDRWMFSGIRLASNL